MRTECFQGLVKICGEYGILPRSHIIPRSKVQKVGYAPISYDSSGVWEGVYEGKPVAIKVMRRDKSEDVQEIKAVRRLSLFSSPKSNLVFCRTFAERLQPGSLYLTRTYWS